MEKQLTPEQAWADFWMWIKTQREWADIKRRPKQYLYKAAKDYRENKLGQSRIKSLLTKYAKDRYRFEERVILIEP